MTLLREDREKGFPGDDGIPVSGAVAPRTRDFQVATRTGLATFTASGSQESLSYLCVNLLVAIKMYKFEVFVRVFTSLSFGDSVVAVIFFPVKQRLTAPRAHELLLLREFF